MSTGEGTIGGRLRVERDCLGITQRAFAQLGGISLKSQSLYELDSRRPDADYLAAIAHAADVQYIITGERSARPQSQRSIVEAGAAGAGYDGPLAAADIILVPRFDVELSAGAGAIATREDVLDRMGFRARWLREIGLSDPRRAVIATVRGDSMAPTLEHRDPVIIDTGARALAEGVYALRMREQILIKRLQPLLDEVVLLSDNPLYNPIRVPLGDGQELDIIGRALWTWRGFRL